MLSSSDRFGKPINPSQNLMHILENVFDEVVISRMNWWIERRSEASMQHSSILGEVDMFLN